METAALVISIFAVLLSVIVAGWAIQLQWSMFKATTDQLVAIGKENVSLGQRIARSLGRLQETATTTRSRLDATLDQLVSGLLGRAAPSAERAASEAQQLESEPAAWRLEQTAKVLGALPAAPAVLGYLAADARDSRTLGTQLLDLAPQTEDAWTWKINIPAVVDILLALDLVAADADKGTVSLTPEGRQIAERLREASHDD